MASKPRVLAPRPWPNPWHGSKNSTHHIIHQHRLARAKLNLPTYTSKTLSAPAKFSNYLHKTKAEHIPKNIKKAHTQLDNDVRNPKIIPTKLPFLTQIAAHFTKANTTPSIEPHAFIDLTKPLTKAAPQNAQGNPPHILRPQIIHHEAATYPLTRIQQTVYHQHRTIKQLHNTRINPVKH